MSAPKYISTAEYAKKHGKAPKTIRQKILYGTLPAIMIGNSYAIREDEPYIDNRVTSGKYIKNSSKKANATDKSEARPAAKRAKKIAENSK